MLDTYGRSSLYDKLRLNVKALLALLVINS